MGTVPGILPSLPDALRPTFPGFVVVLRASARSVSGKYVALAYANTTNKPGGRTEAAAMAEACAFFSPTKKMLDKIYSVIVK